MTIGRAQLEAIVEALTVVLPARQPADQVLKQFFRDHKSLGQKDRAIVADTVCAALRRRRLLEHLTPEGTPRQMALAAIVKAQGIGISQVEASLSADEKAWLSALKAEKVDALPFEIRVDLPDWVIEKLRKNHSDEEILAIGQSLQQPAPLDLRVNETKAPIEPVLDRLERDQIAARAMRYSPIGIRLRDKPALNQHVLFLEGVVEVQDEGSQILGMLLEARRGEMVVDFCAGAGGKTLQLGAAMGSSGRLYAFDVSEKRLANLGPRLKRSGLSNVFPQRISNENDAKVKRLRGKIDRVLVDAPCTGLGTLRRNPDLKWRQTAAGVVELNAKQTAILAAAGALVKPGGRLVYGTCSLLEEENEAVVTAFLAAHPEFRLIPCKDVLARKDIRIPGVEEYLRLLPNVHDTDGFFAAVMERAK
ncbi:RsmB/NOP family class I SAM-dependent RNA methyltransferase [Usitatibacter palustris]|uniref:Ribosomal RNA small subunit methyltransferase B n=1 Tax=Usitatibacter palustris TaxID=2732487 RepID=A0A6M4H3K7_9PROT|nr:RsmB/NOP family class I SAM-dependent RNA methyltransferase [Usitatibacter palustris]QJR14020.1 Ribosomal RNA small subunit methyltransferase B [Usitatibacter palustris]